QGPANSDTPNGNTPILHPVPEGLRLRRLKPVWTDADNQHAYVQRYHQPDNRRDQPALRGEQRHSKLQQRHPRLQQRHARPALSAVPTTHKPVRDRSSRRQQYRISPDTSAITTIPPDTRDATIPQYSPGKAVDLTRTPITTAQHDQYIQRLLRRPDNTPKVHGRIQQRRDTHRMVRRFSVPRRNRSTDSRRSNDQY